MLIICLAGQPSHRWPRVTSNVRHQVERPLNFVVVPAALARRVLQQPQVCRALFQLRSQKRERLERTCAQGAAAGGQSHVFSTCYRLSQSVCRRAAMRKALQVATTPRRSALGKAQPTRVSVRLSWLQMPLLPNPSVKARPNSVPPGPRGRAAYRRPRGPGATPSVPPYLKR